MSKLEAATSSFLEHKKEIQHRELLRDPIGPKELAKSFRRRTWTEMSRSEAGRLENVEKRRKIERRCTEIWAPLLILRFLGQEEMEMEDSVHSAPINSLGLLGKAKMEVEEIFEGGQISSTNGIGLADRV